MRDKLIELLKYSRVLDVLYDTDAEWQYAADHLIENGVTVNEWRPASELPKEDGKYLVVRAYGAELAWQEVCRFANNLFKVDKKDFKGKKRAGWYRYCDGEFIEILTVTHWMPLPEAPIGEEE